MYEPLVDFVGQRSAKLITSWKEACYKRDQLPVETHGVRLRDVRPTQIGL